MANMRYLHYTTQYMGIYPVTTCIKTYETVMGSEVSPRKDVIQTQLPCNTLNNSNTVVIRLSIKRGRLQAV